MTLARCGLLLPEAFLKLVVCQVQKKTGNVERFHTYWHALNISYCPQQFEVFFRVDSVGSGALKLAASASVVCVRA